MFDLLKYAGREFPQLPFVCVRVLDAEIPRVSREALQIAVRSLGGAAFIDLPGLTEKLGREEAENQLRSAVLAQLPCLGSQSGRM
jgi:hypothetical protein